MTEFAVGCVTFRCRLYKHTISDANSDANSDASLIKILRQVSQSTINQRLKFLIKKLGLSVRSFSTLADVSPNNTQNYTGKRQIKPKKEYIDKVTHYFSQINKDWLLTGEGEPFIGGAPTQNQTTVSGNQNIVASGTHGKAIQKTYNLTDCEKERDGYKAQLDKALREVELLTGQLTDKERTIQILLKQGS